MTTIKKSKAGMVAAIVVALAMPVTVGIVATTASVKAEAADFTGKIKRIKIKKRRVGSGFKVIAMVQGDDAGQVVSAEALLDGQKVPAGLDSVENSSTKNTRLVGTLSDNVTLEKEVGLLVTLFDIDGSVLLQSRETVEVEFAPEAIFYSLTIKSRLTAEPVANVIMAAPSKEALLELASFSDQNKGYFAEAEALNADELAVLTPEKYTIAGGAFSAQGNLLNVVTEKGRLFSFTGVTPEKLESFSLKSDWYTSWENPVFQGEVQTSVNVMFE
ncbi:MAG: 6,7-dimethyl-8-ribityllumazine synthase [Thalassolituus sp.]|jgi:6,7-dimethyl-8-ribityllumazine synthase